MVDKEKITDDIYHFRWSRSNTAECTHPLVVKRYASGKGYCIVPIQKCLNCKYAIKFQMFGGVKCGYEKEGEQL